MEPLKKLPDHLGGHMNKVHIDYSALRYLVKEFEIKSMLDVGCGPGDMVKYAKLIGLEAKGIDGDFTLGLNDEDFIIHDYSKGCLHGLSNYDLCWSVEFLEHVDELYLNNVIETFVKCKYIVCTAAPPSWEGHHHVNCQPQEYWIKKFEENGLLFDKEITEEVRSRSSMKKGFMKMTGMFYRNSFG